MSLSLAQTRSAGAAVSDEEPPIVTCAGEMSLEAPGTRWDRFGRRRPGGGAVLGPCVAADSITLLPPAGPHPAVFLSNFGLLFEHGGEVAPAMIDGGVDAATSGRRYGYVCEETFGGRNPERLARHADGRLFLAAFDGLHIAPGSGCGYVRATGSVAFKDVAEVAFHPDDADRVFALTRAPAALHVSTDGGRSFVALDLANARLPADLRLTRLFVDASAPGVPPIVVTTGFAAGGAPLVILRSLDGGSTFLEERFDAGLFARDAAATLGVATAVDLVGASAWFLTAGESGAPDSVFRSIDQGRTWTRVLTLRGTAIKAGITWGATPADVYVAGREVFSRAGEPGADLYVSHDGGASFAPPIASGPQSPHHRCLFFAEGRLYGCGGPPNDNFLFAVSDDDGKSWSPLATLADIDGPRPCTSGRCFATAFWLCQAYGVCAADLPGGPLPDASSDGGKRDAISTDGSSDDDGSDCGCRLGGAGVSRDQPGSAAVAGAALLLLGLVRRFTRRPR
ncbi:MAG TPA: sialidase family protein [Polyangia bacterium]